LVRCRFNALCALIARVRNAALLNSALKMVAVELAQGR
jgi:hypothetical protein